jgi:quinone-modifying oxidoreductase subunit QmoC
MVSRPLWLPLLLAFPALVIWSMIRLGGNLGKPAAALGELSSGYWGRVIEPWPWLDLTFIAAASFVLLSFAVSVGRLWRGFDRSGVQPEGGPRTPLGAALIAAIQDILFHRKFDECGAAHARRGGHMLILFGFGGLFLTTALVFVGMYLFGLKTPLPLGHWIKIIGNASAVAITVGLVMVIYRRMNPAEAVTNGRNAYQDVLFLAVITLTVVTGILCEVLRLATATSAAYVTYTLHLVFIFFLIFYAPYSKFAHVVYHTTALTWANVVGRKLKSLAPDDALPAAPDPGPPPAAGEGEAGGEQAA